MIFFEKIEIKNFISVGDNPMTILLDRSPTTLVTGTNGSGKSAIICDSVTFALFGKSYRGINKPNLINTINKKDCLIRIWFKSGNKKYLIERGIKPSVFNIYENGKKHDNNASVHDQQKFLEKNILKCNFRSFCQTCLLGTANYKPFMRLSAGARRDVIETLLDISVFSDMNKILKSKISDWRDEIKDLDAEIAVAQKGYNMQRRFYNDIRNSSSDKILQKKKELKPIRQMVEEKNAEKKKLEKKFLEIHNADIESDINDIHEEIIDLEKTISSLQVDLRNATNQLKFFENKSECPKCKQHIGDDHKHLHIEELEENEKKLEKEIEQKNDALKKNRDRLEKKKKHRDEQLTFEKKIDSLDKEMKSLVDQGKKLAKEINEMKSADVTKLEDEKRKLIEHETNLNVNDKKKKQLLKKKEIYSLALKLLKDTGIKSSIIKQYLPVLNTRVNHYLNLLNFNVKFSLDESFNETLKARYKNEFSYANFSMGERQRLDLAITFAWRDVARMKNSVNTNLLIFDEIFDSSLDEQGTDDLMTILNEFDAKNNIFIISHKNGLEDKFRSSIRFEKVSGFSKITV